MELRQLEHFVAVADEGSFTRAGQRLGIVQSGISASIKSLERELGTELLERTTHRVGLTPAGEVFLPEARRTLSAAAAAREAIDQLHGVLRGSVKVGTMQAQGLSAVRVNVPELIAAFRDAHPGVDIQLRQAAGGSLEMAQLLREGRLDLAFLGLPRGGYPGITLRRLASEPLEFCCAPGHRFAGSASIGLARIAGETFVDFPPGWGSRMAVDRAFVAAGLERTVAYEVNDVAGVIEFVQHGLGVALMPPSFGFGSRDIRFVPVRRPAPVFEISLAIPSGRAPSPAAQALLESIESAISAAG